MFINFIFPNNGKQTLSSKDLGEDPGPPLPRLLKPMDDGERLKLFRVFGEDRKEIT